MKTPPCERRIVVTLVAILGAATAGAARAAADSKADSKADPKADPKNDSKADPRADPKADPKVMTTAGSGPSALDVEARDLFRSERYADALAIYQRLRTETRHPTYLRNIGRCHQMMRQPTPAIDAFEAYLRDAHNIDTAERTEIEGYIAEMQRLELSAPLPSQGGAPTVAAAPPASTPAPAGAEAPSGADASTITRKWWFWTGIGILAIASGIIVVAASGQDRLACPAGAVCP